MADDGGGTGAGVVEESRRPRTGRGRTSVASPLLRGLGVRLSRARKHAGLTRKVLARASGVSERHIAEVEGGRGNISVLLLGRLGEALGVEARELLADPEGQTSEALSVMEMVRQADPAQRRRIRDLVAEVVAAPAAGTKAQRVALIGLRGAGKSTLGRAVSAALGIPFVELDREIENDSGVALGEIFALYGADGYRRIEQRQIHAVVRRHSRALVAVGGGVVSEPETFEFLLERFHSVWLRASPEEHMARVLDQGDRRPMVGNPRAMEALRAILERRAVLYARADATVDTSGHTVHESTRSLLATASPWLTERE